MVKNAFRTIGNEVGAPSTGTRNALHPGMEAVERRRASGKKQRQKGKEREECQKENLV